MSDLWTDSHIYDAMRKIGGGTRLYVDDAATVARHVRDDLQARIAELEAQLTNKTGLINQLTDIDMAAMEATIDRRDARIAELEAQLQAQLAQTLALNKRNVDDAARKINAEQGGLQLAHMSMVEWGKREEHIKRLEAQLSFAAQYKGIEAQACPLCRYENGVFIEHCQMHKDMNAMRARIAELEAELAAATRWEPVAVVLPAETPGHDAIATVLAQYMSDLSEQAYCAGWMLGCEYDIWRELQQGVGDWYIRDADTMAALKLLSGMIDGWIAWDETIMDTRFVQMQEWLGMYDKWSQRRAERLCRVAGTGEANNEAAA